MTCERCADRGLIRVKYRSGESDDIAICDCGKGRFYRRAGLEAVRRLEPWIAAEAQIGRVEEYGDEGSPVTTPHRSSVSVLAAARTKAPKRPKL